MSYVGLPSRKSTSRWKKAAHRALGLADGALALLGIALVVDSIRSFFTPDASILGVFLRWPGGRALPMLCGALLGAALLVRRRASALVLVAGAALALIDVGEYYALRADGLPGAPVPFALATFLLFALAAVRTLADGPPAPLAWRVAGASLAAPALVLLHVFSFGATDYARPADAIVVLGARVYEDGRPSLALEDRVRHGVRLFHAGFAPKLVLSGAPDEVPAMRKLALEGGVGEASLVLDPFGLNTYETFRNLRERRVVAVSHYYHLARIKLTASRLGIRCATSPCAMTRRLAREPYFVARELAALSAYYLFRG
jgi:uncharacterized SAM-binding protein YcdF (DUF218 family)